MIPKEYIAATKSALLHGVSIDRFEFTNNLADYFITNQEEHNPSFFLPIIRQLAVTVENTNFTKFVEELLRFMTKDKDADFEKYGKLTRDTRIDYEAEYMSNLCFDFMSGELWPMKIAEVAPEDLILSSR